VPDIPNGSLQLPANKMSYRHTPAPGLLAQPCVFAVAQLVGIGVRRPQAPGPSGPAPHHSATPTHTDSTGARRRRGAIYSAALRAVVAAAAAGRRRRASLP